MSAKKQNKYTSTIIKCLWGGFAFIVVAAIAIFYAIAQGWIGYMPPIEELENPKDKFASEIYSADGKVLGRFYQSRSNRVYVNYKEISPYLIEALIATEDARFTSHSGIDFKALMRAFVKRGILMQKSAGGGSTITQQLSKLLYSPSAENVMERLFQKPQEWVIAAKLERFYTKEEIINMYLNHFDFLNNAVGIQSAAYVYFNKTPQNLSIEEAATLVGMCKNPSYYNPRRFNERTRGRRNVVLSQMEKEGYISRAERDSLQALPLTLDYHPVDHKEGPAPYFRERLRMMLTAKKPIRSDYESWNMQQYVDDSTAWENNPAYGWCEKNRKADGSKYNIYSDGLKIYTGIDSRMQQYAEDAVHEHIAGDLQPRFFAEKKGRSYAPFSRSISAEERESILRRSMTQSDRYRLMKRAGAHDDEIEKAFNTPVEMQVFSYDGMIDTVMTPLDSIKYQKSFLRTGFMVMDPHNGLVKAYVGGPDFSNFQYDMAGIGRRQIGSTIKPFLYTLAMEEGFTPGSKFLNAQPTFTLADGSTWSPRNSSTKREGEMVTLRWALTTSNNWISARLIDQLSPTSLARMMHSFGIRNYIDPVLSLCLGPVEVSVEEMVTAYTAFSNNGVRVDPVFVTRIEDNHGNVISEFTPRMTEVFSERAYNRIVPILCDVIDAGTGTRIRFRYHITAPMGGKTGTSNNNSDGWFMAFTPNLVVGTWVGGEDRSIHFDRMADGQGASMALPIAGLFFQKIYADQSLLSEGYTQDLAFDFPFVEDPEEEEIIISAEDTEGEDSLIGIEGIFD